MRGVCGGVHTLAEGINESASLPPAQTHEDEEEEATGRC